MKKFFIIAAVAAVSGNALANGTVPARDCLIAPPKTPSTIDGSQASAEEIQSYRNAVVNFLAETEKRLPCKYNSLHHNRLVYRMNLVSKTFNHELSRYKTQLATR